MNIRATAATANPMRVVRRYAIPLLALETVGLTGLVTSWHIAGVVAIGLTVGAIVRGSLRRASGQIDAILREELSPDRADDAAGSVGAEGPSDNPGCARSVVG